VKAASAYGGAQRAYAGLIDRIHGDGLAVEAFEVPFLVNDRGARSSLIHRVMSAPQVPRPRIPDAL
jgi:hypothetical protein